MTTGEKLQSLRKENNYTQEELADIMSVSRQSISKWESDIVFPETEKLITLSKLYHCSIDYLLNEDNNERNANVVLVNKQETKPTKYNKKRLPLIITTLATVVISLITFAPVWFKGTFVLYSTEFHDSGFIYYADGSSFEIAANFYDLLKIENDIVVNALAMKAVAVIIFILMISVVGASITYLFLDKKPFKIAIRATNCAILVLLTILLILSLAPGFEWTIAIAVAYTFVALQVLLQYVVKPIRVCR